MGALRGACPGSAPHLLGLACMGSGTSPNSPRASSLQPWLELVYAKEANVLIVPRRGICRWRDSNERFVQEASTAIRKELFGNLLSNCLHKIIPRTWLYLAMSSQ